MGSRATTSYPPANAKKDTVLCALGSFDIIGPFFSKKKGPQTLSIEFNIDTHMLKMLLKSEQRKRRI